ncbi:MAG: response regulator transcription factor [Candidatus Poribacteria bacterium]|nr:response regulator transcription factor [Candidatus Poribacteria bacterium]
MLKALLIDDDAKLATLLGNYLTKFDIELNSTTKPTLALELIAEHQPDLIILDVMMPKMNGFQVCSGIRKKYKIPIIMLSARGESLDRVKGLDLGADDYIAKPFEPRELVARIHSLLRRVADEDEDYYSQDIFEVDTIGRAISMDGQILSLTNMEFELLELLLANPGTLFSRDDILKHLRGIEAKIFSRSIDILISRLRQKIEANPKEPKFIKTIWGKGYMFLSVNKPTAES